MRTFALSLLAFSLWAASLRAQQAPVDERTPIPYEFPAYKDATVTMMFGSRKQVKGNIYLDGSKLYYQQDGTTVEAGLGNVTRVQFGDSLYIPVAGASLGLIVAEDSNKMLVCVKSIDKYEMTGRKDGFGGRDQSGEGLGFVQLDGFAGVLELDNYEAQEKAKMFPLKREYFFLIDGQWVPAKERAVLDRYDRARRKAIRELTENRFWSWRDENSLVQLLQLL